MTFRISGKQRAKFSAYELNRLNESADRVLNNSSLIENVLPDDGPQSHWVWIKNNSANDRGRFDCMALNDPIFPLELDGSVDLMFNAITQTGSTTEMLPVILLDDIPAQAFGKGIISGMALARVGAGSTGSLFATPSTSGSKLTPGASGQIKLLDNPSASVDKLIPVLLGRPFERRFATFSIAQTAPSGGSSKMESGFTTTYAGVSNPDTYTANASPTGAELEIISNSGDHRLRFADAGHWLMLMSWQGIFSVTNSLQVNALIEWDAIPVYPGVGVGGTDPGRRSGLASTPLKTCCGQYSRHIQVAANTNYQFGYEMASSRHYTVSTNATVQNNPPITSFYGSLTLVRLR